MVPNLTLFSAAGDSVEGASKSKVEEVFGGKKLFALQEQDALNDEDALFASASVKPGKSKKKKRSSVARVSRLQHTPDVFEQFSKLKLRAPLVSSDLKSSIDDLIKKHKKLETDPSPAELRRRAALLKIEKQESRERTQRRNAARLMLEQEQQRRVEELRQMQNEARIDSEKRRRHSIDVAKKLAETERLRRIRELRQSELLDLEGWLKALQDNAFQCELISVLCAYRTSSSHSDCH